ncbi:MAG: hypothetical protein WAM14_07395 [Candidatus Nitrosopolaris sp.]
MSTAYTFQIIFIDTDEMSAIHKQGVIIKIKVNNYIRVEVIRNA